MSYWAYNWASRWVARQGSETIFVQITAGARNHLPANRSVAFRFEIRASNPRVRDLYFTGGFFGILPIEASAYAVQRINTAVIRPAARNFQRLGSRL